MKSLRLVFPVFVLLAFSFPPADVKLQYEFKVGDEYLWSQSTKQTVKQSIMGMDQTMTNDISGEYHRHVLTHRGNSRFHLRFRAIADADHRDHRRHADDDAEHCQQGAERVPLQGAQRDF